MGQAQAIHGYRFRRLLYCCIHQHLNDVLFTSVSSCSFWFIPIQISMEPFMLHCIISSRLYICSPIQTALFFLLLLACLAPIGQNQIFFCDFCLKSYDVLFSFKSAVQYVYMCKSLTYQICCHHHHHHHHHHPLCGIFKVTFPYPSFLWSCP